MRAVVKSVIILVLAVIIIGPVLAPVVADARDQSGTEDVTGGTNHTDATTGMDNITTIRRPVIMLLLPRRYTLRRRLPRALPLFFLCISVRSGPWRTRGVAQRRRVARRRHSRSSGTGRKNEEERILAVL